MRLLVPVDGSALSLKAVALATELAAAEGTEIHLVNVQPPLPRAISDYLSEDACRSYHEDLGREAVREAEARLAAAGRSFVTHLAVGPVAETIVAYARQAGCDQIVMGSRGLSPLPSVLLGSTAIRVLHLSEIPVTIVK